MLNHSIDDNKLDKQYIWIFKVVVKNLNYISRVNIIVDYLLMALWTPC